MDNIKNERKAKDSLIAGFFGWVMCAFAYMVLKDTHIGKIGFFIIFPIGLICCFLMITGLVYGIKGLQSLQHKMSINGIIANIIGLIVIIFISCVSYSSFSPFDSVRIKPDATDYLNCSRLLHVKIPDNIKILEVQDQTPDSWNQDPIYYIVFQFDKNQIQAFIDEVKKSKKWEHLPLPNGVTNILSLSTDELYPFIKAKIKPPDNSQNGWFYYRVKYYDFLDKYRTRDLPQDSGGAYDYIQAVLDLNTRRLFVITKKT